MTSFCHMIMFLMSCDFVMFCHVTFTLHDLPFDNVILSLMSFDLVVLSCDLFITWPSGHVISLRGV